MPLFVQPVPYSLLVNTMHAALGDGGVENPLIRFLKRKCVLLRSRN